MQWNEQNLLDILESVDSKAIFSESALLDYFTSFLEQCAGPYLQSGMVNKKLGDLFKAGMIRNGEDELGRNQQRVREIVSHMDEKRCFRIDNHLPSTLLKQLFSIDTDIVLVPARFYTSSQAGGASLSVNDASRLLKGVQDAIDTSNSPNQEFQKATLNLSEQIIKGVPLEYRKDLLRRCAGLHVLGAFDCQAGSTVAVSPREIEHAKENGILFGYSQGISPQERRGLAPTLQCVIPNERILLINAETAKFALNQERSLPPCNGRGILRALGQQVRTLGDIKARTKLAGSVDAPIEDIEIWGLRFLLHADINHFYDSDTLWILGEKQQPVWQKLWTQVIGDEVEPWNLLKGAIADRLPRNVLRDVGIKEISLHSVFEELEQHGGSMIDSSGFSKEECNQILREVKDDELWRSLPFHWTLQDKPVRGDAENVYLKTGEVGVDDELLQDTYLIPCSQDNEVSRRQKALLKRLDETAIIKIALSRSDAPNAWRMLLDALQSLSSMPDKLSPELVRHIKNVAWVPSTRGALQKPDDIIDLEIAEAELDRILAQAPNTFTTPSRLELEFREHPCYLKFREGYFARGQESLERLAQVLKGLDTYQIGNVAFKDADELDETVHFLSSYEHPGWRFLAEIKNGRGENIDLRPLVSSMYSQMSLEAIVKLLNWVAGRGGNREQAGRVFNRYLRVFSRSEKADDAVCRLKLLNQAGCWVPSEKLVSDVAGVAAAHVLHHEQAQILANVISNIRLSENTSIPSSEIDAGTQPQASADVLREYFQSWSGRVAPPLTGLFVLLFGADESIKTLCRELLGQHSREWLIEQLPWQIPQGTEPGGAKTWLSGFSREDALEYFRMNVHIHNAKMLRVHSILGNLIQVGLDEEFDTLMVGKPSYSRLNNHNGYQVDLILRKIAVDQCSEKQLSSYLKHSTAYLLREVFNQTQPRLDTLWDELDKSDQVDIDLARSLILQNIPFYLKQLGVHKYPNLNSSLKRYRDEERKEKEFFGTTKEEKYRKAKETALIELQHIIESDEGAQQTILESVRHRIRDYQYQVEGVPFELFQNADDALHDLEMIDAYPAKPGDPDVEPLPPSICRFVVEAAEGRLVFMHWGRAINQFGSKGFPGRDRGYDRDLENMLILSASDKGEDVTGKFGLGFKSVWLVSDRPTVVSGRLQTEIVGGLLPIPVQNVASQPLRKRMSECQPDIRWPGTGIELPLVELGENEVLNQFSKLAGFMVAFARNIRTIDIKDSSGKTLSSAWECRKFPGCNNIYIGYVGHADADLFVLKITLPDGAILVPVGPHGFEELPKEIPSLWVTAPITEQDHLGFAINAMFEVDAGRSRLSASLTENEMLSHRLGKQLALELEYLRESVATKWAEIAANMRLAPSVEPYHFWHSLWTVLMAGLPQMSHDSSPRVIVTSMLSKGMRTLATEHDIVPNGMPGDLKRIVRLSDVKTVLKDALSDNCVLETVSKAPCFRALFDTRTAVSPELRNWLRILFPEFASNTSQLSSLSLSDLFSQLDSDKAISPSDAKILGEALCTNILDSWQEPEKGMPHSHAKDLKRAAEIARELRFISAHRTTEKCKMLLTESYSKDEKLRWAFAPDNNRLAGDYDGSAIEFFLFCRDKFEAPTGALKDWIIQAEDSDRRQAALKYLIEGELASQVIDALHKKGLGGTWLVKVKEDAEFLEGWDADNRSKLIYQVLKTPSESKAVWENSNSDISHPLMPIDAERALHKIYDWWKSARDEQLDKYLKKTYPEGQRLRLKIDEGAFDRSSWLILLLLGGFHTMGRTQPEQHRTFIEICQRRGWWDVFIEPLPAQRFNDWMRVLDEYIDQQVDQQVYEQWMMRFPIIYKLSRHLDKFVELLLGLERYRRDFDLNLVLSPLADADQQGGGVAAPPLGRTLGIGANFVIRDLIRKGIVDSPYLRNHAYVPYKRVRRLFSEMGLDAIESEMQLKASPVILEFLTEKLGEEKSYFCGDFDIPLNIVSEERELQQELLGRALTSEE